MLDTTVRFVCCNCGFAVSKTVDDLPNPPEEIRCINCKAKFVAVIHPAETDKEMALQKFLKKKKLNKEESELVNSVMDSASLVVASGKRAALALAGRGVGPKTASRILARTTISNDDEMLRDVLEAERTYAKNKRFWRD